MLIRTLLLLLLLSATTLAATPTASEIIDKIKPTHPRLIASQEAFDSLKSEIARDPWLKQRYAYLHDAADKMLTQPSSIYILPDGVRLLSVSRTVLERASILSIVWHVEKEAKYKDRLWAEMAAISNFGDWHPKHFLDTAEMTAAAGIGYDWMYDQWTPEQRKTLRDAIAKLGLAPGLLAYHTGQNGMFVKAKHNWNIVCNGGLALGALAIADEEKEIAGEVLASGIKSAPTCLREWAPDGGWVEGPGYWGYTTTYESMYLDALKTATGSDWGLGDFPGMDQAGWFPAYLNGALDRAFNFADSHEGTRPESGPQMLWLARRYNEPRYADYQMRQGSGRLSALEMIWGQRIKHEPWATIPTDRYFRGAQVATMRDRWQDPKAWFVAFKAGSNTANHSHLDIGSFVLEAKGVRWGIDLGSDDYNLPGYFGGHRWEYYRLRAEAHNTLVINPGKGPDQDPKGAGKIVSYESTDRGVKLTADLSGAYPGSKVMRSLDFVRGKSLTVRDEVTAKAPAEVYWAFHTRGKPSLSADGKRVTLEQDKQKLELELTSPGKFEIDPAKEMESSPHPEKQAANPGVSVVKVHTTSGVIEVTFR